MNAEPTPTQPPVEISKYFQATDSLGKSLMRVLMDHIRALPGQWSKLAEARQEELLERMSTEVHQAVQHGAKRLIAAGSQHVVATLKTVTISVDGVKGTIIVEHTDDALDNLSHHAGKPIVMVLADLESYSAGVEDFQADADQNPLPLQEPAATAKWPDYQNPVAPATNGTTEEQDDDDNSVEG